MLDPTAGTWTPVPPPPAKLRSSIDIVVVGDEAIVVGQTDEGVNTCALLHILAYTPSTNTWRELPASPVASHSEMVTVWTGTELFFGGGAICEIGLADGDPRADAHLLDPVTGLWRKATDAPEEFYGANRYRDNWTGQSVVALTSRNSILLYNPVTDSWHTSPTIQQTRIINGATISTPNDRLCGVRRAESTNPARPTRRRAGLLARRRREVRFVLGGTLSSSHDLEAFIHYSLDLRCSPILTIMTPPRGPRFAGLRRPGLESWQRRGMFGYDPLIWLDTSPGRHGQWPHRASRRGGSR